MLGHKLRRMLEVLFCVFSTATAFYWIPIAFPKCIEKVHNYRCNDLQNKYGEAGAGGGGDGRGLGYSLTQFHPSTCH